MSEIKPLRVWTENSIRSAILIGFLAQLFVSLVRYEVPEAKHVATKSSNFAAEFDSYNDEGEREWSPMFVFQF